MKNKALTLTVIANMTSNYGESLGNISSVQKVFRGGKEYATSCLLYTSPSPRDRG